MQVSIDLIDAIDSRRIKNSILESPIIYMNIVSVSHFSTKVLKFLDISKELKVFVWFFTMLCHP